MSRYLLPCGLVSVAQLAGKKFLRLCYIRHNGLITLLALVPRVVALAGSHLLFSINRVHGRIGIDSNRTQCDIAGCPYSFSHPPLNSQNLLGDAHVEGIEETP